MAGPAPESVGAAGVVGELLPCPFCGSANVKNSDGFNEDGYWAVYCATCKSGTASFPKPEGAVTAWNTRTATVGGEAWPGSHHAAIWHWSREVGRAACGANEPNQGLTDVLNHITCVPRARASGYQAGVDDAAELIRSTCDGQIGQKYFHWLIQQIRALAQKGLER